MEAKDVFHKANEVTMFLMPFSGFRRREFDYLTYNSKLPPSRFINAYLREEDNVLQMLFLNYQDRFFSTFNETMECNDLFIDKQELAEGHYLLYNMKFYKPFNEVLEPFKNGEYSKFPKKLQSVVTNNSFLAKNSTDMLSRIFSRDPSLRRLREEELGVKIPKNVELWSSFQDCKERNTLSESVIKILDSTIKNTKLKPIEE